MKTRNLFFPMLSALLLFFSSPGEAYEDQSIVQRTIRQLREKAPEVGKFVDEAMGRFREKEMCATSNESKRPKDSKACSDLLTYEKAVAASDADLKECQEKCKAGTTVAKPVNGKTTDAQLSQCLDQACNDECTRKETLFRLDLEQYLKGSLMESIEMRGIFKRYNGEMMIMMK